jgi:hypothetical protein
MSYRQIRLSGRQKCGIAAREVTHAQQEFVKERQRRRTQLEQGRAALEERTLRLKDIEKAFQVVAKRSFYVVSRSLLRCTPQA